MKQANAPAAWPENRRVARRFLLEPIPVSDPETGQPLGEMVECTRLGLQLTTDVPWLPGTRHRLGIRMLTERGIGRVAVVAECVYCRPDVCQGRYAVGLRVIEGGPAFGPAVEDLFANP